MVGGRVALRGALLVATGGNIAPEALAGAWSLPADKLGLEIAHVGQYAPHDVAKRAGLVKGDVIIGFDGITTPMRESDLLVHSLTVKKPGDVLTVDVFRVGKRLSIRLTLP